MRQGQEGGEGREGAQQLCIASQKAKTLLSVHHTRLTGLLSPDCSRQVASCVARPPNGFAALSDAGKPWTASEAAAGV